MDEVIELEDSITAALISGAVPNNLAADVHLILANAWNGPGKRLNRLREIASAIKQANEMEVIS